ncbi:P-loop containing nucleoside triphosphate hydrolase protein [Fimicolochytrium jonesii]|uniref:P-loop containing nucleoside triphosphate hydrolase protein n=1 Tax=Fimicolochytrium jonesii TaxID=1396493 RepID=UPI0022FE1E73|nr:P-loop containing nucleoside triphosphate hydrolase protein [Fimicolochytrium jonesii]KAI8819814.1 P-loop containing nucleoside triphosphate hydrolase protein [Fimicolochytrium jonesii]
MPPKKQVAVEKPLLGRPGNNLKMGIVGLPNVGKSSFFNALTNSVVSAENYPFCTIDPSEARAQVEDPRFDWLCEHYKPANKVPAFLTVTDIAGLVKGAAEGQGLGNAFLSHIRAVDGIFHLVRAFDDADVIHVEGDLDPVRDLAIIHEELRLKDEEFLTKQLDARQKDVRRIGKGGGAADKAKKEECDIVEKVYKWVVESKKDVRDGDWSGKEIEIINSLQLITAKPVVYLCNLSERDYARKKNKWLPKIKQWIDTNHPGDILIPYSGVMEQKLTELEPAQRLEYLKDLQTKHELAAPVTSVFNKIIVAGYNALGLIYFFTGGPDEVRAWTIRKNTKAPQAAGTIHTDFEKAFIMAEVMRYDDLKELGSDAAVKAGGKYVQKGKDYVVQDGDILYFKAGQVTAPKKK